MFNNRTSSKGQHIDSQANLNKNSSLFKPTTHILLILNVGLLAYLNTIHAPFHFDDGPSIVENYKLRALNNFWPPSGSRWFGILTFAINFQIGGLNVATYHIFNLLIHILNGILVYYLLLLTFKTPIFQRQIVAKKTSNADAARFLIPLFSALFFVVHPIQTQAVTYICQRFASLATMFYLLSIVTYIKARLTYRDSGDTVQNIKGEQKKFSLKSVSFYFVSVISAILAMETKEIAFTLPVMITLYEFMFFEGKLKKRILCLTPLLCTLLIIPLSKISIDKPVEELMTVFNEATRVQTTVSRLDYLFTQFRVIATYIRLLLLPINQNLDYDYSIYRSLFNPDVFLSILFLLTIFWLGGYLLHRSKSVENRLRLISFGIFWFFITLSVESSIIPIKDIIFEHRVYLPSIGLFIAVISSVFIGMDGLRVKRKMIHTALILTLLINVTFLTVLTYVRNTVWQDEIRLWEDVISKSPKKARGYINLGSAYARGQKLNRSYEEQMDRAVEMFKKAITIQPRYAEAYNNLGVIYSERKWYGKAIEAYTTAIAMKPDYAKAYNNRGFDYLEEGQFDKAIEDLNTAIKIEPNYADAYNNRGSAFFKKSLYSMAIKDWESAISIDFNHARAHFNRGSAYIKMGYNDLATKDFQKACDNGSKEGCEVLYRKNKGQR